MTDTLVAPEAALEEPPPAPPAALESAELLESASFGLARAAPELSAQRRLSLAQKILLPAAMAGTGWCFWRFPAEALHILALAAFWLFAALTAWRLLAAGAALAQLPCPRGH